MTMTMTTQNDTDTIYISPYEIRKPRGRPKIPDELKKNLTKYLKHQLGGLVDLDEKYHYHLKRSLNADCAIRTIMRLNLNKNTNDSINNAIFNAQK